MAVSECRLVTYFEPSAWSRRYGDECFTATVTGHLVMEDLSCCCMPRRWAVYEVECKAGTKTWTVRRRVREWLALWEHVRGSIDFGYVGASAPEPPSKTLLPWLSTHFLDRRASDLAKFLNALLVQFNLGQPAVQEPLRTFLLDD